MEVMLTWLAFAFFAMVPGNLIAWAVVCKVVDKDSGIDYPFNWRIFALGPFYLDWAWNRHDRITS